MSTKWFGASARVCSIAACGRPIRLHNKTGKCGRCQGGYRLPGVPWTRGPRPKELGGKQNVVERFLAKVRFDGLGPGGCWLWSASRYPDGYGRFVDDGRVHIGAHIFAFRRFRGEVPRGLELDHLCRVRECCNPDHLEPVTRSINVRRGLAPAILRERHRLARIARASAAAGGSP